MIRGCADETWDLPSFGMVWQQLSDNIRIFGMNDDDDHDDDEDDYWWWWWCDDDDGDDDDEEVQ